MPDSRKKVANLAESCNKSSSQKDQSSFDNDDEKRKSKSSQRLEYRASDKDEDDDDEADDDHDDDGDNDGDDDDDDSDDDDDVRSCHSDDDFESVDLEEKHNECANASSPASVKSQPKSFGGKLLGKLKPWKKLKTSKKRLLAQISSLESEKAVVESKLDQLQLQMSNKAEEVVQVQMERDNLKSEVTKLQLELEKVGSELEKVKELQNTSAALEMRLCRGFLWKRGVRGLTGRYWRYRWFEAKKDGKIRYYKCRKESLISRGFIDARNITGVEDLPYSEQNEENSCFNVVTPNRTYEIKAVDNDHKLRWVKAIQDLIYWIERNDQLAQS